MSLAFASAEPYKNVQFGSPKLAKPLVQSHSSHPLTDGHCSVWSPWALQNSLLYVRPQSITHYIITVHNAINFAGVLGLCAIRQ